MKKLLPALCMLLVSALLLGTSTYAWFSMNTQVTATGMMVKAVAEEGLVISNAANGTYDVEASSTKDTVAQLYPGSTKDLSTWLHSVSTNPAAANTEQAYTAGTAWANNTTRGNYVQHDFYIRSSAAEDLTVDSLDVLSVVANVNGGGALQDLSKSLRVGIKFDGSSNIYIYAPVAGFTTTVSVQNAAGAYTAAAADRTAVTALGTAVESNDSDITSIPDKADNGLHAFVYIWFEGEDESCISNNIVPNLQQLDITITFSYTKN